MDIRVVSDPAEIAACLQVRHEVFVGEQGVTADEEQDGHDPDCVHILAQDDGAAIGAARVSFASDDYAKIQRVAVLKSGRGKGVGAAIILHILDYLRSDGRREIALLGSQVHAMDFYAKLGFDPVGEEYLDARIPHRDMQRKV